MEKATHLDFLLVAGGMVALMMIGMVILIATTYKKVPQGKAIVRTGVGGTQVIFDGGFVFPVLHQMEYMNITIHKFTWKFEGSDGLLLQDGKIIDAKISFHIRVNPEAVKVVAQSLGCNNASDAEYIGKMLEGRLSDGVRKACRLFSSDDIYDNRDAFNQQIRVSTVVHLNGLVIEDVSIDYLQQLPAKSSS